MCKEVNGTNVPIIYLEGRTENEDDEENFSMWGTWGFVITSNSRFRTSYDKRG
ncbi:hypothetical protein JCM19038_547 [Geomicrobium sp. JCM 19038]|nr:hypothetical protein JCM19038_547 [Geomicrobium sp. JCM 19038]